MTASFRGTKTFPLVSPTYEVCQMRRTKQKSIDPLDNGDLVRFVTGRISTTRSHNGLYATDFVVERLSNGNWVECSIPLSQGNLSRRIFIVTSGDPYDEGIFDAKCFELDKPLLILRPYA